MLHDVNPQGFLIFHLNLAFSSIPAEARKQVIDNCYHPLLDLAKGTNIPIGIEVTGWTLDQIAELSPEWLEEFRSLLVAGHCELIGSGYSQLIGPLVPEPVNQWNQKLGIETYQRMLEIVPSIALVNEMAYSDSLVDIYKESGYTGFVMDRDNIRLALDIEGKPLHEAPTTARGLLGGSLPVLWADSMLFQKLQQFAHGDIRQSDYINYIRQRISTGETLFPIYCNDAEIFDYRPGRFKEERPFHADGEWNRLQKILLRLRDEQIITFVSPSEALATLIPNQLLAQRMTSIAHPVPVKKQAKYNIARWAVTGRNDIWLNSFCHRLCQHLIANNCANPNDWKKLCEFWASDYRTHITDDRWNTLRQNIEQIAAEKGLAVEQCKTENLPDNIWQDTPPEIHGLRIHFDPEGILLRICTSTLEIVLNLRRGLAIHSLSFFPQGNTPSIGTLPHGYFNSISLGADYYSGGLIIELAQSRRRVTDLTKVKPTFLFLDNSLVLRIFVNSEIGVLEKRIKLPVHGAWIELSYLFPDTHRPPSSIHAGIITLLPEHFSLPLEISCFNGGKQPEKFLIDRPCDHSASASTIVSSTAGFGASQGVLSIGDSKSQLKLEWDPSECAALPMLIYKPVNDTYLARVLFSLQEVDDTSRPNGGFHNFRLRISASNSDNI